MPYVLSDDELIELWPAIRLLNGNSLTERIRLEVEAAERRRFVPNPDHLSIVRLLELVDWAASQRSLSCVPATPLPHSNTVDRLVSVGWITPVTGGYVAAAPAIAYVRSGRSDSLTRDASST